MNIRKATIQDLEAITLLESRCFPEAEAATKESFQERLNIFADYFWLLEEEGKVIGMLNGMVSDDELIRDEMFEDASLHNKNGAWQMIFGLDTDPDYRNRGYAALLMEKAIEDTKKAEKKGLVLTCKAHLVHYYEKFGYVNEGISDSSHGGAVWYDMRLTF